jgi:hypothetical protein
MVYIDHEKMRLERAVNDAETGVVNAKWALWCYNNRAKLHEHGLEAGSTMLFEGYPGRNALVSKVGLEKCVFDNQKLKMVAPIMSGSQQEDTTIYECPKCKLNYISPLNAKDKKVHERRMKQVRY